VGANIGYFSCLAASRCKHVLAFEPQPINLEYLLANVRTNGLKNIEVFPMALGDRAGVLDLFGASATGASAIQHWGVLTAAPAVGRRESTRLDRRGQVQRSANVHQDRCRGLRVRSFARRERTPPCRSTPSMARRDISERFSPLRLEPSFCPNIWV